MTVQATNYDGTVNYTLLQTTDVKDSLSDSSTNLPLSANMGKVLNDSKPNLLLRKSIDSGEWETVDLKSNARPFLLMMSKMASGSPNGEHYLFMATSGESSGKTGNISLIGSSGGSYSQYVEFNWNNYLSLAIHVKTGNWFVATVIG